jgi:nucleoid-associated protein YgaU
MRFPGSRYAATEVVADADGRAALAARRVPPAPAAAVHVVVEGERLDTLAARFYGDSRKGWRILDANPDVLDPFTLLTPGRRLRVPRDEALPA